MQTILTVNMIVWGWVLVIGRDDQFISHKYILIDRLDISSMHRLESMKSDHQRSWVNGFDWVLQFDFQSAADMVLRHLCDYGGCDASIYGNIYSNVIAICDENMMDTFDILVRHHETSAKDAMLIPIWHRD